jgi:hypothetical protein
MADPKLSESGLNILTKGERDIRQLITESHSTNLMRKLDLHDVASLARYAINNGLIVMGS